MKEQLSQKNRLFITGIITMGLLGHLAWDYFHGGIPTHYLLQNKDMPGIPNWWGAIVLPFFAYFLLFRIHKRLNRAEQKDSVKLVILRFLAGLVCAVSISVAFLNGIEVTDYIMGLIFILAFIFPLYKSEYLLGWVLGSAFAFGAIIPILFGSILCFLFFLVYQLVSRMMRVLKLKTD